MKIKLFDILELILYKCIYKLYRAYLFLIRINICKHIPTQFVVGMYVVLFIIIFKKS